MRCRYCMNSCNSALVTFFWPYLAPEPARRVAMTRVPPFRRESTRSLGAGDHACIAFASVPRLFETIQQRHHGGLFDTQMRAQVDLADTRIGLDQHLSHLHFTKITQTES